MENGLFLINVNCGRPIKNYNNYIRCTLYGIDGQNVQFMSAMVGMISVVVCYICCGRTYIGLRAYRPTNNQHAMLTNNYSTSSV